MWLSPWGAKNIQPPLIFAAPLSSTRLPELRSACWGSESLLATRTHIQRFRRWRSRSLTPSVVPVAFGPMLDHVADGAICIADKIHTGPFHGEAAFGVRDQRDLGISRVDHETASF